MTKEYNFPQATKQPSVISYLIRGSDAPAFVDDFNARVDSDFGGNVNLKVLKLERIGGIETAVGSNSLILPVVQELVSARRVGLPEDLQRTLNDGDTLSIRGNHFVDLGVILDFTGKNHEMALDFYQQLPKELQDFERLPSVVVGYGLKNFEKGRFNLGLTNTERTRVRPAKILASDGGSFSNEDVSLETGLPAKLSGRERILYTSTQEKPSLENLGLSRLYLGGDLDLNSRYDDDLANSSEDGRVVLF